MTASDLSKWDVAFLQKKMLAERSYEEFTHEVKLRDGKGTHYALGLSVSEQDGTSVFSHSGGVSLLTANASSYFCEAALADYIPRYLRLEAWSRSLVSESSFGEA